MTSATRRSILRRVHIILAIPIAGYIYSPFRNIPQYAPATRFIFFPAMVLTGLWGEEKGTLRLCLNLPKFGDCWVAVAVM